MNQLSAPMQRALELAKQEIAKGFAKDWYIEDSKLFVESDQGWRKWFDEAGEDWDCGELL